MSLSQTRKQRAHPIGRVRHCVLMEAVFQAPKRRARVYEAYEAPLPIPTSQHDTTQQHHHLVLKADLVNNHVIVRDPYHILCLYSKVGSQNTDYSCSDPVFSES